MGHFGKKRSSEGSVSDNWKVPLTGDAPAESAEDVGRIMTELKFTDPMSTG